MFRDGTYTAWFRTPRGQGTATVHLAEGRISGGDSFFNYGGTYEIEGDRFTATLTTKRIADGPTTVFGLDEVELKLSGMLRGDIARCSGRSAQAPDLEFEAMLFLGEQQPPPPPRPVSQSNIAQLPKAAGDRSRTRKPFASGPSR
ncbi:MAG TPA: hypothetical protein VKY22_15045 [Bradyrhizobium sp.]|nr:hypothetical protein [Bradyrhizobium sp.]